MCPKIDVMERECKKLEFGGDLNRALASRHLLITLVFVNPIPLRSLAALGGPNLAYDTSFSS
jgi:hypothetical protein